WSAWCSCWRSWFSYPFPVWFRHRFSTVPTEKYLGPELQNPRMLCSEKPCDSRYSSQRSSVHFATHPGHCCFLGTCLLNGGVLGPTCCPSRRAGQRPGDLAPRGPAGPPPPPEPNTAPVRFTESPSGYRAGVPPGRAVGPGNEAGACPGLVP